MEVLGGDVPMAMEESGAEDLEMASVHMVLTWVMSRCSVSYVDTTGGLACGQTSPNGPVPA